MGGFDMNQQTTTNQQRRFVLIRFVPPLQGTTLFVSDAHNPDDATHEP